MFDLKVAFWTLSLESCVLNIYFPFSGIPKFKTQLTLLPNAKFTKHTQFTMHNLPLILFLDMKVQNGSLEFYFKVQNTTYIVVADKVWKDSALATQNPRRLGNYWIWKFKMDVWNFISKFKTELTYEGAFSHTKFTMHNPPLSILNFNVKVAFWTCMSN